MKSLKEKLQEILKFKALRYITVKYLKTNELYNDVIIQTSFFPDDTKISERIYCILNNVYELRTCLKCGSTNLRQPKSYTNLDIDDYLNVFCCISCARSNKLLIHDCYRSYYTKEEILEQLIDQDIQNTCVKNTKLVMSAKRIVSPEVLSKINSASELLYFIRNGLINIPKCYCGKDVNYNKNGEYYQYCSSKCNLKSEKSKQRRQNTNQNKYGCDNVFQSNHIKEKIKETNIQRNGHPHPAQFDYIKHAHRHRMMKYTYQNLSRFAPDIIPQFNEDEFQGCTYDKIYKWKCKCGEIFKSGYINGMKPSCPICFPKLINNSYLEEEVANYIEHELKCDIIRNTRKIIAPKELDIYVPDKQIAIEFNGIYWHSETNGKNKVYHLNKTKNCQNTNIRLIHIFEDEWVHTPEIVKSRLKYIFNSSNIHKIYARKCKIKKLSSIESKRFFDINHIQHSDRSLIRYGLTYNNEIVAVMTFNKPRFSKKYDYELVRFANKLNTSVIGGASKLLKAFCKDHQYNSIVSYADLRWSQGNLYEQLDFRLSHISPPNYWYVINGKRESRIKFQKPKLKEKLEFFDESKTEYENMLANGIDRIWDCGNLVYVLENK